MYQVTIETGNADTQPYIMADMIQVSQFLKLIMKTFNYEVTVTIKEFGVPKLGDKE